MELTLSNLRSDYKLMKSVHPNTALRIATLIEYIKICHELYKPEFNAAKRIRVLALCHGTDISERTLYRWKAAYINNGFVGLTSKKAHGMKAKELTNIEKNIIRDMRAKFRWGAEVIQAHLKYDYSIELTKFRIERFLTLSGLRDKYPCTTKKIKRKSKREHTKVVKIHTPGAHMQMDTKHQPHILENGKKCYVFNIIDHASNWSYKKAFPSLSPKSTIEFMTLVIQNCPFKITQIQTDNGTEYTYKYYKRYADLKKSHPLEKFCEEHGIHQKLIPPGVKELQGLVERSHRQDDQELYTRIEPKELSEFNHFLEEYFNERNKHRRFKKLDWKTPSEWLEEHKKTQRALKLGHNYSRNKVKLELLPKLKFDDMPKSNKQLTKSKREKNDLNSCKDEDKKDDNNITKQAA